MKKHTSTILLVIVFIIGLSLLLYPSISDWWNSKYQSQAVVQYAQQVAKIDTNKYEEIWNAAWEYNRELATRTNRYKLDAQQQEEYESMLDVGGTGVMGYIEIPEIQVTLPIYHGTDEAVLQIAIGHLEWSSLPVGGEGSHCVVSGHRGLPSSKLFTDLDKLVEGDIFMFRVLDEILTYEIDQILIVEPHELQMLQIEEGKDYCTLVTCTPYGINSHRLLLRGHRVANTEEAKTVRVTSDAMLIEPMIIAPIVALPMLLILLIGLMIPKRKKTRRYDQW